MLSPFRMVCRDFILPEFCKPCLFLSTFQFAKLIVPYQKKKLYYVNKYYGVEGGKAKQSRVTTKTKREAREILARHLADMADGIAVRETDESVGKYLEWYIENIAKIKNQPTTIYGYNNRDSQNHMNPLGEK